MNNKGKKAFSMIATFVSIIICIMSVIIPSAAVSSQNTTNTESDLENKTVITVKLGKEFANRVFYLNDTQGANYGAAIVDDKGILKIEVFGDNQKITYELSEYKAPSSTVSNDNQGESETSPEDEEFYEDNTEKYKGKIIFSLVLGGSLILLYFVFKTDFVSKLASKKKTPKE